jgi:hypothetical protein
MTHDTCCIICGAKDGCNCANDPGITTAAWQLIKAIRLGDLSPQHRARIEIAQRRLNQALAEANPQ